MINMYIEFINSLIANKIFSIAIELYLKGLI